MSLMGDILAHKTLHDNGKPVILEHPGSYPFREGERERDWRPATEAEYAAYLEFWDANGDNA